MPDFASSPNPNCLHIYEENRPEYAFSEVSSEPDRLYIHTEQDEITSHREPQTSQSTPFPVADRSYGFDRAIDYSVTNRHTPDAWSYANSHQSPRMHQLFRPFSPISSSQIDTPQSVASIQSHYNGPKSYYAPYLSDFTRYYQTPDAEVSYFSWLSHGENGSDSYYNPGSNRSTMTPSSVSTSHSETPTELDDAEGESDYSKPATENQIAQDTYQRKFSGKPRKRKETMRANYPYKRHPKPPYTYCGMIVTIIMHSPQKKLTLAEIHQKLSELFEFFRGPYTGWKHSVRHNLSYNDCFAKAELAEDIAGEKRNVYYWRVDHTRIPFGALCLQRTEEGRSGDYKDHIHEQLDLSATPLYGFDIGLICRCRSLGLPVRMNTEIYATKRGGTATPASSSVTRLRLPLKTECVLPTKSPEAYRSRDVAANSSFNSSYHEEHRYQSASPVMATGSRHFSQFLPAAGGQSGYNSISQYILSTDEGDWTSNAVENLSVLCSSAYGS